MKRGNASIEICYKESKNLRNMQCLHKKCFFKFFLRIIGGLLLSLDRSNRIGFFFFFLAGKFTELGKTEKHKYIPAWQAEVQALFHSWLTNL